MKQNISYGGKSLHLSNNTLAGKSLEKSEIKIEFRR